MEKLKRKLLSSPVFVKPYLVFFTPNFVYRHIKMVPENCKFSPKPKVSLILLIKKKKNSNQKLFSPQSSIYAHISHHHHCHRPSLLLVSYSERKMERSRPENRVSRSEAGAKREVTWTGAKRCAGIAEGVSGERKFPPLPLRSYALASTVRS